MRLDIFSLFFMEYLSLPFSLKVPRIASIRIRGFDRTYYGTTNNSTIPDPFEVAAIVGVKPCIMAPKYIWKLAWILHGFLLPIMHFRDSAAPRDSSYSLKVLWCKAIASMDRASKVFDHGWTYDTLPSFSRWLLLKLIPNRCFPRLHHANIEARTAYLDKIIQAEILNQVPRDSTCIQLISIGAGYDVRCSRLLSTFVNENNNHNNNNNNNNCILEAYELDLPNVIASKQTILNRLQKRRPQSRHPTLIAVDLNDVNGSVKETLERIMMTTTERRSYTIFISEGVLIYLDKGVPSRLLRLFGDLAKSKATSRSGSSISSSTTGGSPASTAVASFCFADRLENVPGGDIVAARKELSQAGMELMDWCPKPGLARHMGVARMYDHTEQP
jgi:O-methyltransferase involved in polyketide biosynthesis